LSEAISSECNIDASSLFMLVTPLRSITGTTQIAGRAIEDVTFTMREILNFDVRKVRQMIGTAPIAPVDKTGDMTIFPDDFLAYGGSVYLSIEPDEEDLEKLAQQLVFESSSAYGRTFCELLKIANGDFKKIPGYPDVFRPARVVINDVKTGNVVEAGKVDLSFTRKYFRFNDS